MSATWGDRMWDVRSVESFVVGVRMRSDVNIQKRELTGGMGGQSSTLMYEEGSGGGTLVGTVAGSALDANGIAKRILKAKNASELKNIWLELKQQASTSTSTSNSPSGDSSQSSDNEKRKSTSSLSTSRGLLNGYVANQIMTAALKLEAPKLAIEVFEAVFGYIYRPNPTAALLRLSRAREEDLSIPSLTAVKRGSATKDWVVERDLMQKLKAFSNSPNMTAGESAIAVGILDPSAFVCATAAKAYSESSFDVKTEVASKTLGHPPDSYQGYGQVTLNAVLPMKSGGSYNLYVYDELTVTTKCVYILTVEVTTRGPLKVTLVWYDPPSTVGNTVNLLLHNLDLTIIDPNGDSWNRYTSLVLVTVGKYSVFIEPAQYNGYVPSKDVADGNGAYQTIYEQTPPQ
eukprot:gene5488-11035_t